MFSPNVLSAETFEHQGTIDFPQLSNAREWSTYGLDCRVDRMLEKSRSKLIRIIRVAHSIEHFTCYCRQDAIVCTEYFEQISIIVRSKLNLY